MVFVNELSPYIFRFPNSDFGIRWYGLAYVIGFVIAYITVKNAIARNHIPGMQAKDLDPFIYGAMAGVVLGGRLGYCLQHLDKWAADPLFFFRFNQGGMAFFGGLAGVVIAVLVFCRIKKIKFGDLGDVVTVPAALSLGIGRIANFINGELWGIPTNGNWGVVYPHVDRQPRHPSELYEMASHFALAALLLVAWKTPAFRDRRGNISALFVAGYGFFRFITEYFRTADTYFGPLTNGQVASLIIFVIGSVATVLVWKNPSALRTQPEPEHVKS